MEIAPLPRKAVYTAFPARLTRDQAVSMLLDSQRFDRARICRRFFYVWRMTFVVVAITACEMSMPKSFDALPGARSYCKEEIAKGADRADIWQVPFEDARKAIAALKMGEGKFLECHTRKASEEQILAADFKDMFGED
jgi:hypothetical protein